MIYDRQLIINFILKYYSIEYNDLVKHSKLASLSEPKQVCSFLLKRFTQMSYFEIGCALNRTHQTIISNIKTVKRKMEEDDVYRETIIDIVDSLLDYTEDNPPLYRSKTHQMLIGRRWYDKRKYN